MSDLNSVGAFAAASALHGIALVGSLVALGLSLRSVTLVSEQARLAYRFVRATPPILALGILLLLIAYSIATDSFSKGTGVIPLLAIFYLETASLFLVTTADLLITIGAYLFGLALLYNALRKAKFWKLLRLDALFGVMLLLALLIGYFAKELSDLSRYGVEGSGTRLVWLVVIVDGTLLIITMGLVALAFYVHPKLKRRTDLGLGNTPFLYIILSLLWLLRCAYRFANDLKVVLEDWTFKEVSARKILDPIFELWLSVAVLLLLIILGRRTVWSNPAMILENTTIGEQTTHQQPPVGMAAYPGGDPYAQQPVPMYFQGQPPPPPQQPAYVQPGYPGQQPVYPGQPPVYPQQTMPIYVQQQAAQLPPPPSELSKD